MSPRCFLGMGLLWLAPCVQGDDRISIDAKINDQPVRLAFDTGAGTGFTIWRGVAAQLGLKVENPPSNFKPAAGQVLVARTEPVKLDVFGQVFPSVQFSAIEVPTYLPWDIHGLVGWSALKKNIVHLRLADRHISVLGAIPTDPAHWLQVPIRQDRDQLVLTVASKNKSSAEVVLVDTGMDSGIHLSTERWREWRAAHRRAPATYFGYYTPGAGLVVREECWTEEIILGALVFRGVTIAEANPAESANLGAGYAATLGLGALRQFEVVIDGPNGVAYLQAHPGAIAPVQHNRLGAVFAPQNDQNNDLVARVAPNSPAAAARIRDGDVLLKIDELDVTSWRTQPGILPLGRFWEQPAGTKLRLTLRRNDRTIVSEVILRNILGPESKEH